MSNGWHTACATEERIHDLNITKYEKLGELLGMIDVVMLAEEHPDIFCISEKLRQLRAARKDYDVAAAAYLNARMTA